MFEIVDGGKTDAGVIGIRIGHLGAFAQVSYKQNDILFNVSIHLTKLQVLIVKYNRYKCPKHTLGVSDLQCFKFGNFWLK